MAAPVETIQKHGPERWAKNDRHREELLAFGYRIKMGKWAR